MGLDATHDCWHGTYLSFHGWRQKLAEVAGLPSLDEIYDGKIKWASLKPDVLYILLDHSDSDGFIASEYCIPLANRLEELLPHMEGWQKETRRFINGLRDAAGSGEAVWF